MAKTTKKSSRFIINLVFVLLIVYLLYVFIGLQIKINNKKDVIRNQNIQISQKALEKDQLSDILAAETDKEYIEKVAKDLGYVNSDEKVYESISE